MTQVPALMKKSNESASEGGRKPNKPHNGKKPQGQNARQDKATANGRPSLGDQLRKQYRQRNPEAVMPSPMTLKGDGEDHINVSEFGKTELGQLLFTKNADIPLNHSIFGKFSTIAGYWAYLKSGMACDNLRTLTGFRLDARVKKLPRVNAVNFRAMLADGIYQRIIGSTVLVEMVKSNKLPYDLYSEDRSGLRQRPPFYNWFIPALNEVCAAVSANRPPNLRFLRDDRCKPEGSDIYFNFLPEHMRERARQNAEIEEMRKLAALAMEKAAAEELTDSVVDPVDESPVADVQVDASTDDRQREEDAAWRQHQADDAEDLQANDL